MKLFGREVPPRKQQDEMEGPERMNHGLELSPDKRVVPEYVPTAIPESFNAGALAEQVSVNESAEAIRVLDEYYHNWTVYSQEHNLYNDPSRKAMWKARMEAVSLMQELTNAEGPLKKDLREQLEAKLNYIQSDLADQILANIESNEERIRSIHSETPKESKNQLASAVEEYKELAQQPIVSGISTSGANDSPKVEAAFKELETAAFTPEKKAMKEAEQAYLTAYKAFYAQKGAKEKSEPAELAELKKLYNQSRIAYGKSLTSSAVERLVKKGYSQEKIFAVTDRYNNLVRFNEIIKPTSEALYNARLEALGSREKGIFGKSFAFFVKTNAQIEEKLGKPWARVARAVGVTAVAGTAGVMTGALASVGLVGAAGWAGMRIGKSLINSSIASVVGSGVGSLAESGLRKGQRTTKKKLQSIGKADLRKGQEDNFYNNIYDNYYELDEKLLNTFDSTRFKLEKASSETTLQQRKIAAQVISAFITGAGLSAFEAATGVTAAAPHEPVSTSHPLPQSQPEHAPATQHIDSAKPTPEPTKASENPVQPKAMHSEAVRNESPKVPATHSESTQAQGSTVAETDTNIAQQEAVTEKTPVDVTQTESATIQTDTAVSQQEVITPTAEGYDGQFKTIIPLPEGMDPNSHEATEYLNRAYNEHPQTGSGYVLPQEPAEGPVTAPVEQEKPHFDYKVAPHEPLPKETPVFKTESVPVANSSVPDTQASIEQPSIKVTSETAAPLEVAPGSHGTSATEIVPEKPAAEVPSQTIEKADVFVNKYGVSIDPSEPHVYTMGKANALVVYGGSLQERQNTIAAFFSDPANKDKVIFTEGGVPLPETGKPGLYMYGTDGKGHITMTTQPQRNTGWFNKKPKSLPSIDSIRSLVQ